MFAAGLLLGFSLFAEKGEATETSEAFQGACSVLMNFSSLSPQAKHYHEILTAFSDAINKHRQQRLDARRRTTNQFIDQIFTIDLKNPSAAEPAYLSPESGSMDMMTTGGSLPSDQDHVLDAAMGMPGFGMEDAANLPMMWDDLSADWPQLNAGSLFDFG